MGRQISRRLDADRLLAIGLVVGVLIEAFAGGPVRGDDPLVATAQQRAIGLLAGLALAVAIAWRQSVPLVGLGLAMISAVVSSPEPIDAPVATVVAMVAATYSVGAHTRGTTALLGVLGVLTLIAIGVVRDVSPEQGLGDLARQVLVFGGPWLAGVSILARRDRETTHERARIEEAVADERARIARELHDAVAHSIGVVVLQARGARRTMTADPAAATDALDAIESTATEALDEMRRLVGVLRQQDDGVDLAPRPSLRHLGALIDRVRDAGLPVDVSIDGLPYDLPTGVDVSAFRIVQEALTNTLAHAGPATASVVIRYGEDRIDLEISDTGTRAGRWRTDGHGLVGMRERVALYDGLLETGPRPGGGFVVKARLPLGPGTS